MSHIFISHSSRDGEQASRLLAWLHANGFTETFLDFDKHAGLAPGSDWERSLYREMAGAEAVILILTKNWFDSKWCFAEFTQARALGKAIFPLIEAPSGETFVSPDIQHLDLLKDREGGLARLTGELTELVLNARGGFHWDQTRPPYPGLLAFDQADAAIYFGRDDDVRRVIERLNARRAQGGAKLVAVLGASGSGKSSLLRAGVLPRLKRDKRNWIALSPFRPQLHPLEELAQAVAAGLELGADWRHWRDAFESEDFEHSLSDLARDLRAAYGANEAQILVTIDQAEELFGAAEKTEAESFLRVLNGLLDERLPFLVVMALRSDYLGQLQQAPALTAAFEEVSLMPMPLARVRDVIEGPARIAGLTVDDTLVAAAMNDAATDDALPLLAFALRELYDRFGQKKHLTMEAYAALGDAGAQLSPLENAVRRKADEVLSAAKPSDEDLQALKEAFVPAMVRVNAEGEYVRRPASFGALPAKARPLIERLAKARLLIIQKDSDVTVVEVAHEALLRKWPLLRGWLDEEREFLIGKDQLEQDLRDWEKAPASQKTDALLSGLKLTRARTWLVEKPKQLSDAERKFIRAGMAHHDEEAKRREDEQKSRQKLQRFALVSISTLFVLSLAVGLIAIRQRNATKTTLLESRTSRSRFLADLSRAKLQENGIGAAVALAREGVPVEVADWPKVPSAENALAFAVESYSSALIRPIVGFVGHEGTVQGAQFLAEETQVLTWSYDGTARLWDARTGEQLKVLRHDAAIRGARVSANSKTVLTWSFDGTARIWNLAGSGQPIILHHDDVLVGASFSADEKRVLTWSYDGTARLWDASSGAQIAVMKHAGPVLAAMFFDKDSHILTRSFDNTVGIWETGSSKQLFKLSHEGVEHALFLPDQRRLLTWGHDKSVLLWDSATGKQLMRLTHDGPVAGALLTKDASRVLTWSNDKTARIWSLSTGKELIRLRHESSVSGAVLSPTESRIVTWCLDWTAELWDAASGKQLGHFSHTAMVLGASFSLDEKKVLTWSYDSTAKVWTKLDDKPWQDTVLQNQGPVRWASFGSNSDFVWTSSDDGKVRTWNADLGREYSVLRHQGEITDLMSANKNHWLLTASTDGTAELWDLSPEDRFIELHHEKKVLGATYSNDSSKILTWSEDRNARLLNASTGAQLGQLRHDADLLGADFSADGTRVITWTSDGSIRLWAVDGGKELVRVKCPGKVLGTALSPGGDVLLAWSDNGKANLWQTSTGKSIAELPHELGVSEPMFSSDGKSILTLGPDDEVQLWNSASGQLIRHFTHERVSGAALSPGGDRLVTWSHSNTARLWDAGTGKQLAQMSHRRDIFSAKFSPDGKRILTLADEDGAKIWDAATGKETTAFPDSGNRNGGSFYGDGTRVMTWSGEGMVRLWNVDGSAIRQFRPVGGVSEPKVSTDEHRLAVGLRVWDIATGDLLAAVPQPGFGNKEVLASDGKSALTWFDGASSAQLWTLWSPVDVSAHRASAIADRLHPLSPSDRCQAYLATDNCGISDRERSIAGNARNLTARAENPNDVKPISSANTDVKLELVVNERSEVWVFHDKPFSSPIKKIEFNRLTSSLVLISNDRNENFGIAVDPKLAKYIDRADRVLCVEMNVKTGKPVSGEYLPLLLY